MARWRSDADQTFEEIRELIPPEVIEAIRKCHNELGPYDCHAHYEGEWCCIDALVGDEPEHEGMAIWSEEKKV